MSRPARAGSAGRPVTIRATAEERERWERCAELVEIDLSALIRRGIEQQCRAIEARKGKPAVMRARSGNR